MTAAACGATAILRSGGPVAVPFRPCCAALLLRASCPPGVPSAPAAGLCPFAEDPADEARRLLLTEPVALTESLALTESVALTEPVAVGDP